MNAVFEMYAIVAAFVVGGIVIAFFLEKYVVRWLKKIAMKTSSNIDNVVLRSLKGLLIFWGMLVGFFLGIQYVPIEKTEEVFLNHVFTGALILSVAILLSRILVRFIRLRISKTPGLIPATTIISTITRVVVYLVAVLIVLQRLGISISPMLTALGIGGLAVALALQETLTNFFAGIQVIVSQLVRPGDYIKLSSGEEGYVTDITWRNTTVRMLANNLIVIPNSKIASSIVTNYYLPDKELAVLVEVGVNYDSDLDLVEKVTIETANAVIKKSVGGAVDFQAFIRYHTFSNSSILFTVILRAKEFTDQYLLKHEFIKCLHKAYKENAIEIPFPIYSVLFKNQFPN